MNKKNILQSTWTVSYIYGIQFTELIESVLILCQSIKDIIKLRFIFQPKSQLNCATILLEIIPFKDHCVQKPFSLSVWSSNKMVHYLNESKYSIYETQWHWLNSTPWCQKPNHPFKVILLFFGRFIDFKIYYSKLKFGRNINAQLYSIVLSTRQSSFDGNSVNEYSSHMNISFNSINLK